MLGFWGGFWNPDDWDAPTPPPAGTPGFGGWGAAVLVTTMVLLLFVRW